MFCKQCGTENDNSNIKCTSCGSIIQTSYSPLNGGERVSIVIYFLLLCAAFIFGIIPLLISIVAIYIMKKDKKFSPIQKAKTLIIIYLVLLGLTITAVVSYDRYDDIRWYNTHMKSDLQKVKKIKTEATFIAIGGTIATPIATGILLLIINLLFFRILERHKNWVLNHGLFADTQNEKPKIVKATESMNKKEENKNPADELLKWSELKEKGIISEEEFLKEKEKILNKQG